MNEWILKQLGGRVRVCFTGNLIERDVTDV